MSSLQIARNYVLIFYTNRHNRHFANNQYVVSHRNTYMNSFFFSHDMCGHKLDHEQRLRQNRKRWQLYSSKPKQKSMLNCCRRRSRCDQHKVAWIVCLNSRCESGGKTSKEPVKQKPEFKWLPGNTILIFVWERKHRTMTIICLYTRLHW